MADYFSELTQATGLPHYKKQIPFSTKEGAVIGIQNGYVTAIAHTVYNKINAISVIIRFKKVEDVARVRAAITESPLVLEALGEKKWTSGMTNLLETGQDFLRYQWKFSLRKHSAEKVAAVQAAFCEAIRNVAPPLDKRCDICENTSVSELMLYNGIPGYYCTSCQQQEQDKQGMAGQEYEARETNLMGGILFGVAAALAGSIAWGLIAYGLNRIFLWGGVFIGSFIAFAMFKGMGKINLVGQALVVILTIASVIFGDVIFFTLFFMKSENIPFSMNLLGIVLKNLVDLEKESGGGFLTIGVALFGAIYILFTKARKPDFVAKFEPLGQPTNEQAKAIGSM